MKNLKKLSNELNDFIFNGHEGTRVKVTYIERSNSILVQPIYNISLHCMDDVIDFCRGHKLSSYITIVDGKCTIVVI